MVLAVDPGKVTGYVVWSEGKLPVAGQAPQDDFLDWADGTVHAYQPWDLRVVCEKFDIGERTLGKTADAHWSIGQTETLRYFCRRDDVPFQTQSVGEAKSFATDVKLKRLGWYHATPGGHENDAKRHLVVYLVHAGRLRLADLVDQAAKNLNK
jgi:hypothetical protein